jgi:hypothetical protein
MGCHYFDAQRLAKLKTTFQAVIESDSPSQTLVPTNCRAGLGHSLSLLPRCIMPASPSPESIATNTLTIPDIPKEFFEYPQVFDDLRNFLQMYGPLHTFVAIKGFARIMAVYEETASAIMAKSELDKTEVYWRKSIDSTDIEIVQFIANDEQRPTTLSDDIVHFLLRLYFGQVSVWYSAVQL